jgi:hypothetical protein
MFNVGVGGSGKTSFIDWIKAAITEVYFKDLPLNTFDNMIAASKTLSEIAPSVRFLFAPELNSAPKKRFPKNRLVKHLMSSAWSTMNRKNVVTETLDQINERIKKGEKIGFGDDNDWIIIDEKKYPDEEGETKKVIYTLLDAKTPIKFNIRLKSYITAHGRNLIGEIAREDIDGVIRTHTDCVVFKSEMEFDDENLIPEEKNTGKIH